MNTLATGKPDIFKCYAKIMCFALPISYMDEKAVILGQGSFSSYEDFRECVNLVQAAGLDTISVKAPLSFTNEQQAWKICGFVAQSVNSLLQHTQENISLKKKFESLKMIIGMWGASAEERPESLYRNMIGKLSSLLDIDCIAVLVFDRTQRKYTSLYSLMKCSGTPEVLSVNEDDAVVRDHGARQICGRRGRDRATLCPVCLAEPVRSMAGVGAGRRAAALLSECRGV